MDWIEIGGVLVPRPLATRVEELRRRVEEIRVSRGSLSRYGYPLLESIEEAAALWYLNRVMGISWSSIAEHIGVERKTVYLLQRNISNNRVYLKKGDRKVAVYVTEGILLKIAEKMLGEDAGDPLSIAVRSQTVRELVESARKEGLQSVRNPLRILLKIVILAAEKRVNLPVDPDAWSREHEAEIVRALKELCREVAKGGEAVAHCVESYAESLRRVPRFRTWFRKIYSTVF